MADRVKLPTLDVQNDDVIQSLVFMKGIPLDEEIGVTRVRLQNQHQRLLSRERQLEEMTIDRDLWQSDHNEDCPNAASLESIKSLHADIIDQGRLVQIGASGESKYGSMSAGEYIDWVAEKLEGK